MVTNFTCTIWIDNFIVDFPVDSPCHYRNHIVSSDKRRHYKSESAPVCDKYLTEGWYRFVLNDKPAVITSTCLKVNLETLETLKPLNLSEGISCYKRLNTRELQRSSDEVMSVDILVEKNVLMASSCSVSSSTKFFYRFQSNVNIVIIKRIEFATIFHFSRDLVEWSFHFV